MEGVRQTAGYSAIIYIAALAERQPGAGRKGLLWRRQPPAENLACGSAGYPAHCNLTMLIFACGNMINIGFDKVFLMQNSMNLAKSEVIATFVYKVGLVNADYGFSTAAGLFQSLVSFIMLVTVNQISKKLRKPVCGKGSVMGNQLKSSEGSFGR